MSFEPAPPGRDRPGSRMVPTLTEALNSHSEGDKTFLVDLRYFSGALSKGDRPLGNPLLIALGTSQNLRSF